MQARQERLRAAFEKNGVVHSPLGGYVTISLPLDLDEARPDVIKAWLMARELVTKSNYSSGYCGYALSYDCQRQVPTDEPIAGQIAYRVLRYPGLDWAPVRDKVPMSKYDPVRGDFIPLLRRVNWLNLVADRSMEQFPGGRKALEHAFQKRSDIKVTKLAHGLLVQAGDRPGLADTAKGIDLPTYRAVAQILRPIRVPRFHDSDMSDDDARAWLEAFDEPNM